MEEIFDAAYDRYLVKKEGSAKQRKRARLAHADKLEKVTIIHCPHFLGYFKYFGTKTFFFFFLLWLLQEGDGDEEMKPVYDSDMNEEKDEANPLVIPLDDGETQTKEEIFNQWYSQDIFAEAVEEGDLGKEAVGIFVEAVEKGALGKEDSDDEMPTKKQIKTLPKPDKSKQKATKASVVSEQSLPITSSKKEEDFEIVPAPATDSDSDSSSDDDIHTKAEILACGKKMLRKKQREEMLDDAYNKYMSQDEGLPKWFVDDEKQHRKPMKPITKEEVNAMKAQFKGINARPAKKVAEAKARKKRAAQKRLEKVRKKANTISDTADIADRSKDKMIDKLYKKAAEPRKPRKELVVSKKGVGVKVGKGQKRVDRRMKSDARQRGGGKPGRNGKKSAGGKAGQKGKKPRGKRPMGGG